MIELPDQAEWEEGLKLIHELLGRCVWVELKEQYIPTKKYTGNSLYARAQRYVDKNRSI